MPNFERAKEIIQPFADKMAAFGHNIAAMPRHAEQKAMGGLALLGVVALTAVMAGKAEAANADAGKPVGYGATIGHTGFGGSGILAEGNASGMFATSSSTAEINDPKEACIDLAQTQPTDFGLGRVKRHGRVDQLVRPFMNLEPVTVGDHGCADFGVTRIADVYETMGGKRNTVFVRHEGNDGGMFSAVVARKHPYRCGKVIQGVVRVEADTNGQVGGDPFQVYRTNKAKIDC